MPAPAPVIRHGFPEDQRPRAARLFWAAFSGKLGLLMGPDARALAFFERVMDPAFAISALDAEGRLVGLAGFKTARGALTGGGFGDLAAVYGLFGAAWRTLPLALLERDIEAGVLLMDGIMVDRDARGQGIGSLLLAAIKDHAAQLGCHAVRLDVIDTNLRARALYERQGFRAGAVSQLGPLRYLFGFRSSTTMTYTVTPEGAQH